MDTLKIWVAFGLGVTAGAAIALILAPQSGEKTRRQLKRRLEDATDHLQNKVEEVGDCVGRSIHKGQEVAVETMKAGVDWAAKQVQQTV